MAYFMPLAALWPRPNDVSFYPWKRVQLSPSQSGCSSCLVSLLFFLFLYVKLIYNNQSCTAVREHARDKSL